MYRVAICDDEMIFAEHLREITQSVLRELEAEFEITVFTDEKRMLSQLTKTPNYYHIILLDIILDQANGVDLAKQLRSKGVSSSILFVTSTKDYTLEGYSVYPIHYLLKPVSRQKLFEVLEIDYRNQFLSRHIILPSKSETQVLLIDHIFYFEVLNRKIMIHTCDRTIEYSRTLKELLMSLPDELFVQCHKSFVVNMLKMASFSSTKFILNSGEEIPVGRAFYKSAISRFISYLERS